MRLFPTYTDWSIYPLSQCVIMVLLCVRSFGVWGIRRFRRGTNGVAVLHSSSLCSSPLLTAVGEIERPLLHNEREFNEGYNHDG